MPPRKDHEDWDEDEDFEEMNDESGEEEPDYYAPPAWLQDEVDSLEE